MIQGLPAQGADAENRLRSAASCWLRFFGSRDHAVGFALREVLELHDKQRVEVYAYYCGDPVANDETQTRIKSAVACWRDISALSDLEAARMIYADDVDILIDVNGYTKHARTKIFAYRPAPVIVNFCGYPGSMGSPFHHYIIADEHIVPAKNEIYYSEKVPKIPCAQPIDRNRSIAAKPSRAQAGLPEDAFVFACFNGMQKITEETFNRWMRILNKTPSSVLWLLSGGENVDQRLREAANNAGVATKRLIFAPKVANAKHLARIALADLFLDTFPYGAHSTAADALTAGVPVLTFPGKAFAARFCHSIVHAAGGLELVCSGPDEYIAKAVRFQQVLQASRRRGIICRRTVKAASYGTFQPWRAGWRISSGKCRERVNAAKLPCRICAISTYTMRSVSNLFRARLNSPRTARTGSAISKNWPNGMITPRFQPTIASGQAKLLNSPFTVGLPNHLIWLVVQPRIARCGAKTRFVLQPGFVSDSKNSQFYTRITRNWRMALHRTSVG